MSELSHVDGEGRARMVDVSAKSDTTRIALAAGELRTTAEVVRLVRADGLPKADVLATARIAGIAGAKRTSELIPLCHQLALSSVQVRFDFTDDTIRIEATAKTKGPTGVEMEALTAVAVAGLTLHDMVKALDPEASLNAVRLLTKDGGKQGHWERSATPVIAETEDVAEIENVAEIEDPPSSADIGPDLASAAEPDSEAPSASVLIASTGAAAGTRTDTTGPLLAQWLVGLGFSVRGPLVYPDDEIGFGLADALRFGPQLVVTTGGTGVSPSDATPEATLAVVDRELPGIAEAIRRRGAEKFPMAALSRGVVGQAGSSIVVNLPGSPGGVRDGIAVLEPLLNHLLAQVAGGGNHDSD